MRRWPYWATMCLAVQNVDLLGVFILTSRLVLKKNVRSGGTSANGINIVSICFVTQSHTLGL